MKAKIRNASEARRRRRHMHIRNTVVGTPERPRVCIFRSSRHIYAQLIDDTNGVTLAAVSSLKREVTAAPEDADAGGKKKKKGKKKAAHAGAKVLMAKSVGQVLAETAKEKGITKVAFDRGGFLYHGRVAALAESAREHGLEF